MRAAWLASRPSATDSPRPTQAAGLEDVMVLVLGSYSAAASMPEANPSWEFVFLQGRVQETGIRPPPGRRAARAALLLAATGPSGPGMPAGASRRRRACLPGSRRYSRVRAAARIPGRTAAPGYARWKPAGPAWRPRRRAW